MNYLYSSFNCVLVDKSYKKIDANVLYELKEEIKPCVVFGNETIPFYLDFSTDCKQVLTVNNGDKFYVLNNKKYVEPKTFTFKHLNNFIYITISNKLVIYCDSENVLNCEINNVEFSHYETDGKFLIIYFTGVRNYVVILNGTKLEIASYYDEFNIKDKEKIFMCKLHDSLNHGNVFKIKENVFEKFLVYLDDYDLNLKSEFLGCVFLDCILAGNLKYCNNLLIDNLKQKDCNNIKNFFPDFDDFIVLSDEEFILTNKNALAGICKILKTDNLISNIIL